MKEKGFKFHMLFVFFVSKKNAPVCVSGAADTKPPPPPAASAVIPALIPAVIPALIPAVIPAGSSLRTGAAALSSVSRVACSPERVNPAPRKLTRGEAEVQEETPA